MPEAWTGDLVKQMHLNRVSATQLAEQAGVTNAYVSMILNGKRNPNGAREMLESALDAIIKAKR